MTALTAAGQVHASPAVVFGFLSDLRNHWQLTGSWVALDDLTGPAHGPTGATVVLRGPLGLSRTVHTSVVQALATLEIRGRVEIGPTTRAAVRWVITPLATELSRVTLEASVLSASRRDAAVLRLGGGRWLAHRFADTIERLDQILSPGAPPLRPLVGAA